MCKIDRVIAYATNDGCAVLYAAQPANALRGQINPVMQRTC